MTLGSYGARAAKLGRRLGGYAGAILLTGAVGLVSVPTVIAAAGIEAWSAIAVGQAVGLVAGTVVAFGWPVVGPAMVAGRANGERAQIYSASLRQRVSLLIPAGLIAIPTSVWTAPDSAPALAVAMAATTPLMAGLGATWFFVGESSPARYNTLEIAPRLVGICLGIVAVSATRDITWFVGLQFAGQAASVVLSTASVMRRYGYVHERLGGEKSLRSFLEGLPGFATSLVSNLYQNAPLLVVAHLAPASLPTLALADRIYRVACLAVTPVTQVAQGYVPAGASAREVRHRAFRTLHYVGWMAAAALVAFAVLAPGASRLLSAGQEQVPRSLAIPFAVALAGTLVSSVAGRAALVALGGQRALAIAAIAAALVGISATFLGATATGAVGAAWGIASAEVLNAVMVVVALLRIARKREEQVYRVDP